MTAPEEREPSDELEIDSPEVQQGLRAGRLFNLIMGVCALYMLIPLVVAYLT